MTVCCSIFWLGRNRQLLWQKKNLVPSTPKDKPTNKGPRLWLLANRPLPLHLGRSCGLQARLMRCIDRAGLETFGLVHEHNLVTRKILLRRPEIGEKKLRCGRGLWRPSPWPRRLPTRRGRFRLCCRVVDPHHDRRGEILSSVASFPLTFPNMCPNVNR